MRSRLLWMKVGSISFLWLGGLCHAVAQEPVLQAELMQPMAADHLKEGSGFTLEVLAPWQERNCQLVPGALLHADIAGLMRSPVGRVQGITFTVEVPCGDQKPLPVVVTSLLAPPEIDDVAESFPGYSSAASGGVQANPLNFDPTGTMKASSTVIGQNHYVVHNLPKTVSPGQVWRLPHVRLVLPSGGGRVSTVVTEKRTLELPTKTVFVLQHVRRETQPLQAQPVALAGGGVTPAAVESPRGPKPFVGDCHGNSCRSYPALPATEAPGPGRVLAEANLVPFGMLPERDREVSQLELGTSVHFLAEDEILITFPSRELVRRRPEEGPSEELQAIRAVLFDTKTKTVERVEHWLVHDHNTYVWPMGRNLLVHQGSSLRLYGPGLKELASFPLELPLHALRVSPDGKHLIVGVVRELHTRVDHQKLVETITRGPQEEVRWSLLGGDLQQIRVLGTTSNFVPVPVLLNDSMVELQKGNGNDWFLVGRGWTSEGADRQMGSFQSSCFPAMEDVEPNLLAMTTCDDAGRARRTALVRENGTPVVEQSSTLQELRVAMTGASLSPRVALMLTDADADYQPGKLFHFSTLRSQRVEIFGAENGVQVASIPMPEITHFRQAFALSPDGRMVAILAGQQLRVYALER